MTPEELKKLAEIAGVELHYNDIEQDFVFVKNHAHHLWHPHLRIEQAFMVAEALVKQDIIRVFTIRFSQDEKWECVFWWAKSPKNKNFIFQASTAAEAITRAALEALKEG